MTSRCCLRSPRRDGGRAWVGLGRRARNAARRGHTTTRWRRGNSSRARIRLLSQRAHRQDQAVPRRVRAQRRGERARSPVERGEERAEGGIEEQAAVALAGVPERKRDGRRADRGAALGEPGSAERGEQPTAKKSSSAIGAARIASAARPASSGRAAGNLSAAASSDWLSCSSSGGSRTTAAKAAVAIAGDGASSSACCGESHSAGGSPALLCSATNTAHAAPRERHGTKIGRCDKRGRLDEEQIEQEVEAAAERRIVGGEGWRRRRLRFFLELEQWSGRAESCAAWEWQTRAEEGAGGGEEGHDNRHLADELKSGRATCVL